MIKYHILLERFQVIFSLVFKRKFAPKIGVHTDDEKIQKPWGGVQSQIFGVIKRGRKNIYRVHRTSSPDWALGLLPTPISIENYRKIWKKW